MKAKKSHATDYLTAQQKYDDEQYWQFFSQCKVMKKSNDLEIRTKGKALEKSYRLFKDNGVPFAVAKTIFPQICKIFGDYSYEFANTVEVKKNGQP